MSYVFDHTPYFLENHIQTKTGYPSCGTFHYMSPEHTGKICRPIDHRSDIYGLGIVFYELLCGNPPLSGINGRIEILFAHVALEFPSLHLLSSCHQKVPLVISQIVAKMLKKEASDRYQSCLGLLYDLEASEGFLHIFSSSQDTLVSLASQFQGENGSDETSSQGQLKQLQMIQHIQQSRLDTTQNEVILPLGTKDMTCVLQAQSKIYGRTNELQTISRIFSDAVSRSRNAVVIVLGYSGSGKTMLVNKSLEHIKACSKNSVLLIKVCCLLPIHEPYSYCCTGKVPTIFCFCPTMPHGSLFRTTA